MGLLEAPELCSEPFLGMKQLETSTKRGIPTTIRVFLRHVGTSPGRAGRFQTPPPLALLVPRLCQGRYGAAAAAAPGGARGPQGRLEPGDELESLDALTTAQRHQKDGRLLSLSRGISALASVTWGQRGREGTPLWCRLVMKAAISGYFHCLQPLNKRLLTHEDQRFSH